MYEKVVWHANDSEMRMRRKEKVYILINGSFDLMCVRHSRFMSDTRIFVKRNAR